MKTIIFIPISWKLQLTPVMAENNFLKDWGVREVKGKRKIKEKEVKGSIKYSIKIYIRVLLENFRTLNSKIQKNLI